MKTYNKIITALILVAWSFRHHLTVLICLLLMCWLLAN